MVLEFLEQRDQAVRRFVQHRCAGFMADGFEAGPPFLAFGRQKSFEAEASAGQAAAHQSSGGGAGARDADHGMAGLVRCGHQLFTGVADARQPGITDHRQALTLRQQIQQLGHAGAGVVLMKGQLAAARSKAAQQLSAVPGVFTGDHIHAAEQVTGAW